jgi:5-methylcytosine-specific restriction protein A
MVTDTATKGYYVYLYAYGRPEVHLSLNQGTTAVVNEFAGRARSVLRERAALMRARLPDFAEQLDVYSLQLGSNRPLPLGYEAGHAFGRRYTLGELPSEEQLRADLLLLSRAYLALTFRGGLEPSSEDATGTHDQTDDPTAGKSLLEVRQYRMHRRIDRHPRAAREAKEHHGTTCQGCGF